MRWAIAYLCVLAACGDERPPERQPAATADKAAAIPPAPAAAPPMEPWIPGKSYMTLPVATEKATRPQSRPSRVLIVPGTDGEFLIAPELPPVVELKAQVRAKGTFAPTTTPIYARVADGPTEIAVLADVNSSVGGLLNGLATVADERAGIAVSRSGFLKPGPQYRLPYVFGRPDEIKRAALHVEIGPSSLEIYGSVVDSSAERAELVRVIAETQRTTSMTIEPELAFRSDVRIDRVAAVLTTFAELGVSDLKLVHSAQLPPPVNDDLYAPPSYSGIPKVTIGVPTITGDYDKAITRRYLTRNLNRLTYCYEKELLARPGLKGTLVLGWTILPDGRVEKASASGVAPEVAACFASVIAGIEFPRPKNGMGATISYPFTLRLSGG